MDLRAVDRHPPYHRDSSFQSFLFGDSTIGIAGVERQCIFFLSFPFELYTRCNITLDYYHPYSDTSNFIRGKKCNKHVQFLDLCKTISPTRRPTHFLVLVFRWTPYGARARRSYEDDIGARV